VEHEAAGRVESANTGSVAGASAEKRLDVLMIGDGD
jgi:hypothetical protein